MENVLKVNDVFTYEENDYIALDEIKYNGETYFFVNKLLSEDEPGKEFMIFKINGELAKIEKNKSILDILYDIFSKRFNQKLEEIANNQ